MRTLLTSVVSASLLWLACGKGSGASITAALKLGSDGALGSASNGLSDAVASQSAALNASASGTAITSLKYYVWRVQICKDLQINGTAYGQESGCLEIYRGPVSAAMEQAASSQDVAGTVNLARASDSGFIDFMSPTSRASLQGTVQVTSADVGDYNWGLVSAYYPVKVNATISIPGTTTPLLYTHDGLTGAGLVNGQTYMRTNTTTPLTSGPATEAVMAGNMTGWFRFQRPFSVTADDIAAGTGYALDLAFNPDGIIQGVTAPGATNFPPLADAAGNTISMSNLTLTAVAHKASSRVMKETYLSTIDTASDSVDLRLELYYLDDDPAKSIYSVGVLAMPNDFTQGYIAGAPYAYYIQDNHDGSISLLGYDHSPTYANFVRRSTVGQTTTAVIDCGGSSSLIPGCSGATAITFTLTHVGALQ